MNPFTRLPLLLAVLVLPAFAGAESCPPLPAAPPTAVPAPAGPAAPYSVYDTAGGHARAPLGIGHLYIPEDSPQANDWLAQLRLPLWQRPDADFLGWLAQGRLLAMDGTASALTGAGLVETGYELNSVIVWEHTAADWLRLRIAPGRDAWTHRCHLPQGSGTVRFEAWEDFLQRHGDWLHFRDDVPHRLRAAPDPAAAVVTRIGSDHKLEWLERRGDWLRVRVQQPDTTCTDPERRGAVHEGWVKWRDAQLGPLLWIYTRGC